VRGDDVGTAQVLGQNLFGAIGDGTTTDRYVPSVVAGGLVVEH